MLRVSERTERIEHVPQVLYHWRKHPGSLAASTDAKDGIARLQASAVAAHLGRCRIPAVARPHPSLPHRAVLAPAPRAAWPEVTVIVPTRDAPAQLERCLGSIFERSSYPRYRVRLIDNRTTDPDALRLFDRYPVDVVPLDEPFNFSRANNLGVAGVSSEVVIFLNNDTEVRVARLARGSGRPPRTRARRGRRAVTRVSRRDRPARGGRPRPSWDGGSHPPRSPEHHRRLRGLALLHAGGLGCDRRLHGDPTRRLSRAGRLRRAFRDALPGCRPPPAPWCDGRRNLFTPRVVVRHDESVTRRGRVRPPRSRAPPRQGGA